MRGCRSALACLGFLLFIGLPVAARADAHDAFRKAIQAADRGRWEEAVERLREAIQEDPQESDRRVLISGVFSRSYLPHFYLGQALYQLGQDRCEDALGAWNTSLAQGAIQENKAQLQELEEGLRACNGLLLPPVISAATLHIERAAALEARLPSLLPDPSLNDDIKAAREDLAEARHRFEEGRASARLSDLREAESRARSAGQKLAAIESQMQQAQQRFTSTVATVRAVLDEADRAESQLADQLTQPQIDTAWHQSGGSQQTDALRTRLQTTREELNKAEDLPRLAAVQSEADAVLVGYREATTKLQAILRANPPRTSQEATGLDTQPKNTPSPPTASPADLRPPATIPAPEVAPDITVRETLSEDAFRTLTANAERLLSRLDADSKSDLVELQRSRLTLLLREGREPTAENAPRLALRTQASLEALRLLAGTQAYLSGQAQEAVRLLDNHEIPPSPLAAQTHLFLAASRFALFHIQSTGDTSLLQQATASAQQAYGLNAALALDSRVFSPSFQNFFAGAVKARRQGL